MNLLYQLPVRTLLVPAVATVVLALNGCATETLYSTVPTVPVNISPEEESDIVGNSSTTFVWRASENAQYYEFHIFDQVTKDINQHSRGNLRASDVCSDGTCRVTLDVVLPTVQDHAWRVRAANNAGFSGWSRTRFNVVGEGANSSRTPNVPNPLQPLTGSAAKFKSLVDFVWRSVPDATSYDFHLFDSVNRTMVDALTDIPASTVCQGGENCQLTRKVSLPPSDDHAWRIRAVNSNGQSAWTRIVFTIEP